MAFIPVVVTRDEFTEISDGGEVSVAMPDMGNRLSRRDRVEVIVASEAPDVPGNYANSVRGSIVMENSPQRNAVNIIQDVYVPPGEKLFARWIGEFDYDSADDLYVVVF